MRCSTLAMKRLMRAKSTPLSSVASGPSSKICVDATCMCRLGVSITRKDWSWAERGSYMYSAMGASGVARSIAEQRTGEASPGVAFTGGGDTCQTRRPPAPRGRRPGARRPGPGAPRRGPRARRRGRAGAAPAPARAQAPPLRRGHERLAHAPALLVEPLPLRSDELPRAAALLREPALLPPAGAGRGCAAHGRRARRDARPARAPAGAPLRRGRRALHRRARARGRAGLRLLLAHRDPRDLARARYRALGRGAGPLPPR